MAWKAISEYRFEMGVVHLGSAKTREKTLAKPTGSRGNPQFVCLRSGLRPSWVPTHFQEVLTPGDLPDLEAENSEGGFGQKRASSSGSKSSKKKSKGLPDS